MEKILFISHNPHECHLELAKAINSRIKITPFNKFVNFAKKSKLINYFYIIFSFFYGLFLKCPEKIVFVDGGSSIWVALGLKFKKPFLKIIYLDGDGLVYYYKRTISKILLKKLIFKKIFAVISVSEQNKELTQKYFKGTIKVIHPWPKKVKPLKIKRKNYGLYVGRLDFDKNIKLIIKFALQCPYLEKMIIVGDGTLKNYVKKISKKYPKIVYIGKVKDPSFYYRQCKFLIHLAEYDPFPTTTLEAVVCDCIPLISKNTGSKILFDKIFIIENPNDFNEINKRINYILRNEREVKEKLKKIKKKVPVKEEIKRFKIYLKKSLLR